MMPMGMSRCGFFRFLRRRRDCVEADVSEEDNARAPHDAADSEVSKFTGVGRQKRMIVRVVDIADTNCRSR